MIVGDKYIFTKMLMQMCNAKDFCNQVIKTMKSSHSAQQQLRIGRSKYSGGMLGYFIIESVSAIVIF